MNIKKLNEELNKLLDINELKKQDAGEEIQFTDFNDAVDKLRQKYEAGQIKAYCPNVDTIKYNDQEYELCLVLGISESEPYSKPPMDPHGMSHYLHKHINDKKKDGKPATIDNLIGATKNVKAAFRKALQKPGKYIAFNKKKNKIVFSNHDQSYIYVICLAKDKDEITYLHNLFPNTNPNYIENRQNEYRKEEDNDLK